MSRKWRRAMLPPIGTGWRRAASGMRAICFATAAVVSLKERRREYRLAAHPTLPRSPMDGLSSAIPSPNSVFKYERSMSCIPYPPIGFVSIYYAINADKIKFSSSIEGKERTPFASLIWPSLTAKLDRRADGSEKPVRCFGGIALRRVVELDK